MSKQEKKKETEVDESLQNLMVSKTCVALDNFEEPFSGTAQEIRLATIIGVSLMMGKPIILVTKHPERVPAKLASVVTEIINSSDFKFAEIAKHISGNNPDAAGPAG